MCSLRDSVQEYVQALEDTDKKIKECPPEVRGGQIIRIYLKWYSWQTSVF